jgi:hypothetical protein
MPGQVPAGAQIKASFSWWLYKRGSLGYARLAWLWKSRFHFHGGFLLQDSHANAHALLSELGLNSPIS